MVWRIALCLLGVQLVGMLVFTTIQYQRFNLTNDFAGYAQAWTAIAHGHMSPFSSVLTVPFWRNDFELLMWPLALFYWVYPHAVTLLWLQVFAVVGGELVVLSVGAGRREKAAAGQSVSSSASRLSRLPPAAHTVELVHDRVRFPLCAFRSPVRVACGPRPVGWPLSAQPCCVGSPYVAFGCRRWRSSRHRHGAGEPAEQEWSRRRVAIAVVVLGVTWLALAAGLGAMRFEGLQLSSMYGYLSGHPKGPFGLGNVVEGLAANPLAAFNMFESHLGYILGYIVSAGIIGLYSRWGLLIAAIVLLPKRGQCESRLHPFRAGVSKLASRSFPHCRICLGVPPRGRERTPISLASSMPFGTITVAACSSVTADFRLSIPGYIERVSPAAAGELSEIADEERLLAMEVIAITGCDRPVWGGHMAFSYWARGGRRMYSLTGKPVVFILCARSKAPPRDSQSETRRAIQYVGTVP